ncbi:MAG: cytochrome c [Acidobacteria bacterium]|nr:cytochrome c [Acidobacteriota bacterium]
MIERYLDREELRRLLAALAVVLAGLSVAALFAILVVPGMRNASRPEAEAAVRPVTGNSGWLDPTEFPPARGRDIPPVDPDSLMEPTPELRARGEELYAVHCVTCHGPRGEGDGPAAGTMNPRPRNLAGPEGWVHGRHLPGLFRTLDEGIPKTSMTPYDFLSRKDRMALAHHVLALGPPEAESADAGAVAALRDALASAGERVPNRIPVSMAMARLADENAAADGGGPPLELSGSEILGRVVADPSRASLVLARSDRWRPSEADLATFLLPGIPGNGFSPRAATLTPEEWERLHRELLRLVARRPVAVK